MLKHVISSQQKYLADLKQIESKIANPEDTTSE